MKKRKTKMTTIPRRQPDLSMRHSDLYRSLRRERFKGALDKLSPDHSKNFLEGFRKGYREGYDDGYNNGYEAGFSDAEYNLDSVKKGRPQDLKWRGKKDLSWYWL